jgi:hypothetical protein
MDFFLSGKTEMLSRIIRVPQGWKGRSTAEAQLNEGFDPLAY